MTSPNTTHSRRASHFFDFLLKTHKRARYYFAVLVKKNRIIKKNKQQGRRRTTNTLLDAPTKGDD